MEFVFSKSGYVIFVKCDYQIVINQKPKISSEAYKKPVWRDFFLFFIYNLHFFLFYLKKIIRRFFLWICSPFRNYWPPIENIFLCLTCRIGKINVYIWSKISSSLIYWFLGWFFFNAVAKMWCPYLARPHIRRAGLLPNVEPLQGSDVEDWKEKRVQGLDTHLNLLPLHLCLLHPCVTHHVQLYIAVAGFNPWYLWAFIGGAGRGKDWAKFVKHFEILPLGGGIILIYTAVLDLFNLK